jgi:hypothetical protein
MPRACHWSRILGRRLVRLPPSSAGSHAFVAHHGRAPVSYSGGTRFDTARRLPRSWRNGQTRSLEVAVLARASRFKSGRAHLASLAQLD